MECETMRRHVPLAVTVLLLFSLMVSGCGTEGGSGGRFEGIRWMLESYSSGGGMKNVPQGSKADALFERGNVSGNSGVNTYSGSYKVSGSSITIGRLASTMMAGPEDLMKMEQAYLANLDMVASYTAGSAELTLYDTDGKVLLTYSKGKTTKLTGATWSVVSYYNGRDAVTGVINGTRLTALFGNDGTVSGSAGLNDYSATYKADGKKISIGPPALKSDIVDADPAISQQQTDYLAALQVAATYEITGDTLKLLRGDGGIAVNYQLAE
jgi:heat shock protein HslJ